MVDIKQLRLIIFSGMMICQMNVGLGIGYELELTVQAKPLGVIGDRSVWFSQLQDAYNYSDGHIDISIIAFYVLSLISFHTITMFVININDISLYNGRWLIEL